jgi:nicotinate-nucleotide pyrophosphorylase (carboxylating)
MNWVDEGALYSQIGLFLREDLGRGDLTSQSILARNTRARGRFIAGDSMIVAGLEAAEEVFLTIDTQQQLEAFVSDGEQVEAGKLIARVVGFADVLLAGESVALNLIQHLSGVATLTNQFVKAVAGTPTQIVDSRVSTPGLRMLERYAVSLGGGANGRFGLDDGVLITANHCVMAGGVVAAVTSARDKQGHVHRIAVEVGDENEVSQAVEAGADTLVLENVSVEDAERFVKRAQALSDRVSIECGGSTVTVATARPFADAGVGRLSLDTLRCGPSLVSFKISPF